jgi:outer membrane receptor for ferrienterochelin and colicin
LAQNPDVVRWLHQQARAYADSQTPPILGNGGGNAYLRPGTPEFTEAFNRITTNPSFNSGGSRFISGSAFYHAQGEYEFKPSWATIKVGARYRYFMPSTDGTVLADTLVFNEDSTSFTRQNIDIYEVGGHVLAERRFLRDRIILSLGSRIDKSKNFDPVFSPAFSAVFKVKQRHYFRINLTNAVRNPTISDQYLFYNVGRARLQGNLNGYSDVVDLDDYLNVTDTAITSPFEVLRSLRFDIRPIRPEVARTLELGYKANPWNPFFIDATFWYSIYEDFIGFNLVSPAPTNPNAETIPQPLRISANATEQVTTIGFTGGFNYFFWRFYNLNGNYTYTELAAEESDPIIPAYNTPRHKFNVGFGARELRYDIALGQRTLKVRNLGFNVNFKWVEGFLFEGSPQFTGFVEEYWTLDAQVSYKAEKLWNAIFKLGASNLMDRRFIQVYGGPEIGRMAYFQVNMNL